MNRAKILAVIIKMLRASYVAAAQVGAKGGPREALLDYMMSSKTLRSSPSSLLLKTIKNKNQDELLSIIKSMSKSIK